MFFRFIKNNLFTFWRFFCEKRNSSLSEGSVIRNIFVLRLSKDDFLVFLNSFLHTFCWILWFSLFVWLLSFKTLFLYLESITEFFSHKWDFLCTKVFFSDRCMFIKACVGYFYQIFIFSPNDSPSKSTKNVFYFI